MDRSPWTDLRDARDATRFGHKAATLARLREAGVPVVDGWVLDTDRADPALEDAARRREFAAALLERADHHRWILRSTSPAEDRPGQSAAGWFASPSAGASVDELSRALAEVLRSAHDPRLLARFGSVPPLAVLAQPQLSFRRWCTAEFRDGAILYEGLESGERRWSAEEDPELDELVRAAVAATGTDPALLEIGQTGDATFVLQLRPAPARSVARPPEPQVSGSFEGLGTSVYPGDDAHEWVADLEHCPTPLSVLLATCFGRWIAADAAHTQSRLVHGRWHDPATTGRTADRSEAEADWQRWRLQLAERVQPALHRLEQASGAVGRDLPSWRLQLEAWFGLQRAYFAMPTGRARSWARAQVDTGSGGLAHTPSADRIRRWRELRQELFAHPEAPAASAAAIERWMEDHADDPVAERVRQTARRDGAVAPLPYDGFTPGLDQDPWPLYRALARGLPEPATAVGETGDRLARAILALAETDNELLLRAYALWRSTIRRLAALADVPPLHLHMLDAGSLEAWLEGGPFPEEASRRGRALHTAWAVAPAADAAEGDTLRGTAAAGGTAEAPAARAAALLELEDDGTIAVVDTLGPADAIAVPRFAAVVCAAGDVLGHASVLCREFGIPCVVGVEHARERLARARTLFVDGDHGVVRIVD